MPQPCVSDMRIRSKPTVHIDVKCGHCGKKLAELAPGPHLIKCPRCGWFQSENGCTVSRP